MSNGMERWTALTKPTMRIGIEKTPKYVGMSFPPPSVTQKRVNKPPPLSRKIPLTTIFANGFLSKAARLKFNQER